MNNYIYSPYADTLMFVYSSDDLNVRYKLRCSMFEFCIVLWCLLCIKCNIDTRSSCKYPLFAEDNCSHCMVQYLPVPNATEISSVEKSFHHFMFVTFWHYVLVIFRIKFWKYPNRYNRNWSIIRCIWNPFHQSI